MLDAFEVPNLKEYMNMIRMHRLTKVALLTLSAVLIAAACSSGSATGIGIRKLGAKEAVTVIDQRTVIDVRSAGEAASGIVAGATVLDFNSGEFEAKIGSYDRSAAYFVYCRSGSRSGQAVEIMKNLGFTDVIDGGAYADLVDAGAPTAP
jgi:phage shock protein E